jgi:SEC-C motif-containing protein
LADNAGLHHQPDLAAMSKKSTAALPPCGGPRWPPAAARIDGAAIAHRRNPDAFALYRLRPAQRSLSAGNLACQHPSDRAHHEREEKLQWLGLEVKSALRLRQRKADDADENRDTVEFVARFKINGRASACTKSATSYASRQKADLRWFYVDGSFPE